MSDNTNATRGGLGFCGTLTIVLIALKLLGLITLSWWWVWAPMWAPALLFFLFLTLGAVFTVGALVVPFLIDEFRGWRKRKRK